MKSRYVLSPQAAKDLVAIWRYVEQRTSQEAANHVESGIRDKIRFLTATPGGGHTRSDLTDDPVKFLSVYSYLMVYRPETRPLQVVAILHGKQDVRQVLKGRLYSS